MPSPIQNVPLGLLGALSLKSLGRNPGALADQVAGVIELMDLYGVQTIAVAEAFGNVSTVGAVQGVTVPANECWRVHAISVALVAVTGIIGADGWGCSAAVSPGLNQASTYVASTYTEKTTAVAGANGYRLKAGVVCRPALILPPGGRVIGVNDRDYSGNVQLSVEVHYDRLAV